MLIAIVITSVLMIVSFVVVDVATKQLQLANTAEQSQYAFYNADSGVECAQYWDLHYSNGAVSAFATTTGLNSSITCNGQSVSTNSQTVPVPFAGPSLVGGGDSNATSTFSINFNTGCAIVQVNKAPNGLTTIQSRGYNTCNTSSDKRLERGITIQY